MEYKEIRINQNHCSLLKLLADSSEALSRFSTIWVELLQSPKSGLKIFLKVKSFSNPLEQKLNNPLKMAQTMADPTVMKQKMYWYLTQSLLLNVPLSVTLAVSQQMEQRTGATTMPPKKLGRRTPPIRPTASEIFFLLIFGCKTWVHNAATRPPNAPTARQALMLGYKVAHCATIAGPQNTEMIIELMLIFLVLPNTSENVIHEMIPAISLKNIFKTPTLNLFVPVVVLTGWINTVEGIVQNTIVVPKIDMIELTFDGIVLVLVSSYFLFKKILQTRPKKPANVQINVKPKSSNTFLGEGGQFLQQSLILQQNGIGHMILYITSDTNVSKRSILPIVAKHDTKYEIVIAIVLRSMIMLMQTPVSYWQAIENQVLLEAVVRLNQPTNTLNQNFCSNGLSWMLRASAKITVPKPKAVPRPKNESIKPTPTAKSPMKKQIGRLNISQPREKSRLFWNQVKYENLPVNPQAKSMPIWRAIMRKPRKVSFLDLVEGFWSWVCQSILILNLIV